MEQERQFLQGSVPNGAAGGISFHAGEIKDLSDRTVKVCGSSAVSLASKRRRHKLSSLKSAISNGFRKLSSSPHISVWSPVRTPAVTGSTGSRSRKPAIRMSGGSLLKQLSPTGAGVSDSNVNVNHFFRWYDKQIFMFFGNEFLHHCGKQIFMSGGKHFFT